MQKKIVFLQLIVVLQKKIRITRMLSKKDMEKTRINDDMIRNTNKVE